MGNASARRHSSPHRFKSGETVASDERGLDRHCDEKSSAYWMILIDVVMIQSIATLSGLYIMHTQIL